MLQICKSMPLLFSTTRFEDSLTNLIVAARSTGSTWTAVVNRSSMKIRERLRALLCWNRLIPVRACRCIECVTQFSLQPARIGSPFYCCVDKAVSLLERG